MTISLCMGTYNGEKYIREQLESIKNQTLKADELIICDDGSQDSTVSVIRTFIQEHHLEGSWKLYRNPENMGYPKCFYHAMSLCTGDIVFLSDQDDIWHERKLERMAEVFSERTEVQTLVCKFGLVDGAGRNIRSAMAPTHSRETGELRQVSLEDVFYKGEWPGMVMAYRRDWYQVRVTHAGERICPKVWEIVPHDLLLSVCAAEEGGFWQTDQELAWHRRHDSNAGGEEHHMGKLLNKERKLGEIETYLRYLEVISAGNLLKTEEGRKILNRKQASMSGRYEALRSGKTGKVLGNAWRNRKSVRLATLVCDLVICRRRDKADKANKTDNADKTDKADKADKTNNAEAIGPVQEK